MAEGQNFAEEVKKYTSSHRLSLPIFDAVSLKLQMELVRKEPNLRTVEKLITADQTLSGTVLKIANSPQYRGLVPTTTVKTAIVRMGMSEIARIVFTEINLKKFSARDPRMRAVMKKLWQHSLACAFAAGLLSKQLDFGVMQHEAFFAGLFHDVGKLLVLKVLDERRQKNPRFTWTPGQLNEALSALHAEQGYLLMQKNNMPETYALIARDHHAETYDRSNYLLLLVRTANAICHHLQIGLTGKQTVPLLEREESQLLHLSPEDVAAVETFLQETAALME